MLGHFKTAEYDISQNLDQLKLRAAENAENIQMTPVVPLLGWLLVKIAKSILRAPSVVFLRLSSLSRKALISGTHRSQHSDSGTFIESTFSIVES